MSEVLFLFFVISAGNCRSDADPVDDSKYSVTTNAQNGFHRVQAGNQDGRIEGQDDSAIIVALESSSAACKAPFPMCHRWCISYF